MMKLKAPTRPREALELLGHLGEGAPLRGLLERVDWGGVSPRQIYTGILNRLPETAAMSVPGEGYSALSHAEAAFLSNEFQDNILTTVLDAFPEKRRLLFVHVPKCAGTDLIENLSAVHPSLHEDLGRREWTGPVMFFEKLRQFVVRAALSDSIFISGHIPLSWYIEQNLYRFGDRMFSVVRQPYDVVISQVNYVLKRFFEAPKCHHPDTREWADFLGFETFDTEMSQSALRAMAFRILSHPQIVTANYLCAFLGNGTADSAIEMMARCDIELTDTSHYKEWLLSSWNIDSSSQANKSTPYIKSSDLDASQRSYVFSDLCREDLKLYDRIMAKMQEKGAASVFGWELI